MHTVEQHFEGKQPVVRTIYDKLLALVLGWGPVDQDPKKTSIHLNRTHAFAGIAIGKGHLVLTLRSRFDIDSSRIKKREQASANRWYCEIKLTSPDEIDDELIGWLRDSYDLS
ncbi:MAG: hypothetical protein JO314_14280 [Acidobacteria bacterium]|nr:hypothetical protein [Acidobacteriota bacterium]